MHPMQAFVKKRSGTPPSPAGLDRRTIGANSKVKPRSVQASYSHPPRQTSTPQAQRSLRGHPGQQPADPARKQDLRGPGRSVKRDFLETDEESLGTTDIVQSVESDGGPPEASSDYGSEIDPEGDKVVEDHHEDQTDHDDSSIQVPLRNVNTLPRGPKEQVARILNQKGLFNEYDQFSADDSYPTTTSGVPDDFPERQVRELTSDQSDQDHEEKEGNEPPSPQGPSPTKEPQVHALQRVFEPPSNVPELTDQMNSGPSVFQRARVAREAARSQSALPIRNDRTKGSVFAAVPPSQPPSYSQISQAIYDQPPRPQLKLQTAMLASELDQRTNRTSPRPRFIPPSTPVQTHIHFPTDEGAEPGQMPTEDYEPSKLFNMPYEQLRDEDFDLDPNPPVLSDDRDSLSIPERIRYVHENLAPEGQSVFFASLSADNWESAGDWFLDEFSALIKKMKDARQQKRKLSREFEEEIEKRHYHVAKKQQLVQNALGQMKSHGQTLLPRTPHKTPQRNL